MSFLSTEQADNVTPPVSVWAQTVDATSRAYDLTGLALGGDTYSSVRADYIYLTIQADGADLYVAFGVDNSKTIAQATAVAAGGTPAFATTSCMKIPDSQERCYRINRAVDKFLYLKGSGAGTARIYASSDISPGATR
jgi:hypothetical protein